MSTKQEAWRSSPGLSLAVETFGEGHEVLVAGELDIAAAAALRDALVGLGGTPIVVDVTGLEFIDAAGLSALLLGVRRARARGQRLRVRGAHGVVRRVITAGGLGHLLELAPS